MNPKKLSSPIGAQIRALRKARKLSQSGLARLIWKTNKQSRIANWENGKYEPNYRDLLLLAQALGVTPDSFLRPGPIPISGSPTIPLFATTETGMSRQGNLPFFWPVQTSDDAFALIVGDDACAPVIRNGEVLVVDPKADPDKGNVVLIRESTAKPTIASFVGLEGSARKFKSLSDQRVISLERKDASRLLGVVVSRVIPGR